MEDLRFVALDLVISVIRKKELCYCSSYLQGRQCKAACSTEQVSIKCSHRRCCVPHRSTHRVNILDFLPRDKWFVLKNCCWEGRKKKSLFYYSEVHFNLHKRHCVCDGLHEGKHYSPASSARKKIREIWGGLKTTYCNAEF